MFNKRKAVSHDSKLYKDAIGKSVYESIKVQTDLGYHGIEKLLVNYLIPIKERSNYSNI